MDGFNGTKESGWLLVGNLLNWIEVGKDNGCWYHRVDSKI